MHANRIILMATAGMLAAQVSAPADPLENLVRDSPFMPGTGMDRTTTVGESGPLELRSVVFEKGRFYFSVYDQGARESKWVTLGQDDLPFVPRSFNQEKDILTVEYQGRTVALELQRAQMAGQATPASGTVPPPLPSADDSGRPSGERQPKSSQSAPGPAPGAAKSDESQRLQEMADEVRRRRQQPVQSPSN